LWRSVEELLGWCLIKRVLLICGSVVRHRQFLKLSKIDLTSQKTKTRIYPKVDRPLEEPQEIPSSDAGFGRVEQNGRSAPTIPSTPQIEEDKYKHADMVAVKSTNVRMPIVVMRDVLIPVRMRHKHGEKLTKNGRSKRS